MASQGPRTATTVTDDSSVGSTAWSNPGNAATSDDSRASATIPGTGITHRLKFQNFGFTIPSGYTITGFVASGERSGGAGTVIDNEVYVTKDGSNPRGSNHAVTGIWPGSDAAQFYGDSLDTWGNPWNAEDINATTFGAFWSAKGTTLGGNSANVDALALTVYYQAPALEGSASLTARSFAQMTGGLIKGGKAEARGASRLGGGAPVFLKAGSASMGGRSLLRASASLASSARPMRVASRLETNASIQTPGGMNLFLQARGNGASSGLPLYLYATDVGVSGVYRALPLVTYAGPDANRPSGVMPLYLAGAARGSISGTMPLFVGGAYHTAEGSIPLYVGSSGALGVLPLYTVGSGISDGYIPANSWMNLFLFRWPSASLSLYLAAPGNPVSSGISLYGQGHMGASGVTPLFVSGVGVVTTSIPLSLFGF